jgi:NAD(P)-dependent dehydrogenase (short-subunit alcohol dehydrogenase family)
VRVAVLDLDDAAVRVVASQLAQQNERSHLAVPVDVTDRASVEQAVGHAAGELDRIDALVIVAGGDVDHGAFEDTGDEVSTRVLELNLLGVVRCCRSAVPHLRRSTSGPSVVTVSSVNAFTALGSEAYSSAKAGLTSLTGHLAATLAHDGVRVNAVAPGTIRTRVWDGQEGGADRLAPMYPLGRVGEPEDVAAAVAFLASSDAAWITGHTLPVDGGLLTGDASRMDVR